MDLYSELYVCLSIISFFILDILTWELLSKLRFSKKEVEFTDELLKIFDLSRFHAGHGAFPLEWLRLSLE